MASFKTREFGQLILKILFTGEEDPPASYWLGLGVGDVPTSDDITLADLTEPTVEGYARVELVRGLTDFADLSEGTDGWAVTSLFKNFTFDGDSTEEVTHIFLCTVESGTAGVLCAVGDTDTFQIVAGASFDAAYQQTEFTT